MQIVGPIPYKTKQFFFVLIKLSIVFGALYFIFTKLTNNKELDFSVFIEILTKNAIFSIKNVIFLLILTFFNWFLEILKWQNLVKYLITISFYEAFKQSLAALTASLFTPNRIGDYAAKTVYYKKSKRKRILLLNLIANMFQMSVTLLFGIVGFLIFIDRYPIEISYYRLGWFFILILPIIAFGWFISSNKKIVIRGFPRQKIWDFIKTMPRRIHFKTFGLSILRYLIFSFQFYFLLQLFGTPLAYLEAMIIISSMYLLASLIPSIFIFDVVIKGSVAIYLFSFTGVNSLVILCIITLMWLLNFVLPSLVGSYYVLNFKIPIAQNESTNIES